MRKSQDKMKKYADRNKKEVVRYKVGDKILLSMKVLSSLMLYEHLVSRSRATIYRNLQLRWWSGAVII